MNILFRISLIFKFLFNMSIPLRDKWWIIVPLIYVLSPIDLIPEPVLGFGFIDDIIVLGFLFTVVNDKTKKYYNNDESYKSDNNNNYNMNGDVNNKKIIENVEYEVKEDEEDK